MLTLPDPANLSLKDYLKLYKSRVERVYYDPQSFKYTMKAEHHEVNKLVVSLGYTAPTLGAYLVGTSMREVKEDIEIARNEIIAYVKYLEDDHRQTFPQIYLSTDHTTPTATAPNTQELRRKLDDLTQRLVTIVDNRSYANAYYSDDHSLKEITDEFMAIVYGIRRSAPLH